MFKTGFKVLHSTQCVIVSAQANNNIIASAHIEAKYLGYKLVIAL